MSNLPPPPEFEPTSSSQPPPPPDQYTPYAEKGWATTDIGQSVVLAGAGQRFLARIVDVIIVLSVGFVAGIIGGATAGFIVGTAFGLVYEVSMIASSGQTVGKMATRIKVIRTEADEPPGWDASFYRWALPGVIGIIANLNPFLGILGLLPLLIYLSLLWGKNRQGWHDMVAKTFVVKV